jgi:hypothetical protein
MCTDIRRIFCNVDLQKVQESKIHDLDVMAAASASSSSSSSALPPGAAGDAFSFGGEPEGDGDGQRRPVFCMRAAVVDSYMTADPVAVALADRVHGAARVRGTGSRRDTGLDRCVRPPLDLTRLPLIPKNINLRI